MNGKRTLKIVALIFGGLLVFVIALGAFVYITAPDRFNVLIVGSDQRGDEQARSDVLMVFSIPKSPHQPISLITIPRDTRVEVPGHGTQKITHAYALGEREDGRLGGVTLTRETVEDFLGIDIHASAEFTFESFRDLVDELGGVDTDEGHVDGEEALSIVRDRYRAGGDFARTEDQREIFLNLGQTITTPAIARQVYNFFTEHPETRLKYSTLPAGQFAFAAYARRWGNFDLTNTYSDFIPGGGDTIYTPEFDANLYYWVPDEAATKELVKTYLK
ncbi:MAG: LCP family protein [bacterium]|nr:LCP family protein [bacterium]